MDTQKRPTIADAIGELAAVADYESWDVELELLEGEEERRAHQKQIGWLRDEGFDTAMQHAGRLFTAILTYLRSLYSEDFSEIRQPQVQRGLRAVMVLVADAASKMDEFLQIFHGASTGSVLGMRAYRDLQNFYYRKLEAKASLEHELNDLQGRAQHESVEIERVWRDLDYELFSLRTESGEPYLSDRLIQQVKLAVNFGIYAEEEYLADDPLIQVQEWKDHLVQVAARNLIDGIAPQLNQFYPKGALKRDSRFYSYLGDALLALRLASLRENRMWRGVSKCCYDYFKEFISLLRESLLTEEYQRLVVYQPESGQLAYSAKTIVEELCFQLYTQMRETREVMSTIQHLIAAGRRHLEEEPACERWAEQLRSDHLAIVAELERHPNGPLLKIYDQLQEGIQHTFDPLQQDNLPERYCELRVGGATPALLRMASPTVQEQIHQASIAEEFRAFLRACRDSPTPQKVLLINLQDATSWKEHARARAIENLAQVEEFKNTLTVVTLAKQNDFYHQLSPYGELREWALFRAAFLEQMGEERFGYHIEPELRHKLFPEFAEGLLDLVHETFFQGRAYLERGERMECIDLIHSLFAWKLVERTGCDFFAFVSKDGLDLSAIESQQMLLIMQLLSGREISRTEWEWLRAMLYAPTLLVRERALHLAPMRRLVGVVRRVEEWLSESSDEERERLHRQLESYFSVAIVDMEVVLPLAADEAL